MLASRFLDGLEKDGLGYSEERDERFVEQILAGNVPEHQRIVHPVPVGDRLTLYVMCDYVSVGSDEDFVRASLNPMSAQRICSAIGGLMPTRKMVDAIWKAAGSKLEPAPWGPPYDSSMMSTYRIREHHRRIQKQFDKRKYELGSLVAGHKKDVVISLQVQRPADQKVAIYGWHRMNGQPIQGPGIQAVAHEITYRDYAHGIRIVSNVCLLDGKEDSVTRILKDPELVSLLSDEKAGNDDVRVERADPFTDPRYVEALRAA